MLVFRLCTIIHCSQSFNLLLKVRATISDMPFVWSCGQWNIIPLHSSWVKTNKVKASRNPQHPICRLHVLLPVSRVTKEQNTAVQSSLTVILGEATDLGVDLIHRGFELRADSCPGEKRQGWGLGLDREKWTLYSPTLTVYCHSNPPVVLTLFDIKDLKVQSVGGLTWTVLSIALVPTA